MILVVDTETTNKVNFKVPLDDPCQPWMVSCSALLYDEESRQVVECLSCLIKPTDWVIPPESTAIHGITHEKAMEYGMEFEVMMPALGHLARSARRIAAYNQGFDSAMMKIMYGYYGLDSGDAFAPTKWVDVMKPCTEICQLPGKYGTYKWPKLEEAFQHFFGKKPKASHSSLNDAHSCAQILFKLIELEVIKI